MNPAKLAVKHHAACLLCICVIGKKMEPHAVIIFSDKGGFVDLLQQIC